MLPWVINELVKPFNILQYLYVFHWFVEDTMVYGFTLVGLMLSFTFLGYILLVRNYWKIQKKNICQGDATVRRDGKW